MFFWVIIWLSYSFDLIKVTHASISKGQGYFGLRGKWINVLSAIDKEADRAFFALITLIIVLHIYLKVFERI